MTDAKQILERLKRRRKVEDALLSLRRQTCRSVPRALWTFASAGFFAWLAYDQGVVEQVEGKSVLLFEGCLFMVLSFSLIGAGIRELWVNPRDRLLIQIAEDYLSQSEEPNQSNQATGAPRLDCEQSLKT